MTKIGIISDILWRVPVIALTVFCISAAAFLLVPSAAAEVLPSAKKGTLLCGGNYSFGGGGNDLTRPRNRAIWNLRNYNDVRDIVIKRIRLFDSTGTTVFDSDTHADGLPPSRNGEIGSGGPGAENDILGPHESVQFRSEDLVPSVFPILPETQRPLQFVVDWKSNRRVLMLDGSLVRHRLTGVVPDEEQISRHQYDCRLVR